MVAKPQYGHFVIGIHLASLPTKPKWNWNINLEGDATYAYFSQTNTFGGKGLQSYMQSAPVSLPEHQCA